MGASFGMTNAMSSVCKGPRIVSGIPLSLPAMIPSPNLPECQWCCLLMLAEKSPLHRFEGGLPARRSETHLHHNYDTLSAGPFRLCEIRSLVKQKGFALHAAETFCFRSESCLTTNFESNLSILSTMPPYSSSLYGSMAAPKKPCRRMLRAFLAASARISSQNG